MEVNSALNQIKLNTKNFCLDGDFVLNAIDSEDYFVNDLCPKEKEYLENNFDNFLELTKSKKSIHYLYNLENLLVHLNKYSEGVKVEGLAPLHRLGWRFKKRIRSGALIKKFNENQQDALSSAADKGLDSVGWSALFYKKNKNNISTNLLESVSIDKKLYSFSYKEVMQKENNVLASLMNEKRKSQQEIHNSKDFFYPFQQASNFYVIYDPFLFSSFSFNKGTKNHMLGHDQRKKTPFNTKNLFIYDDKKCPETLNDFNEKFSESKFDEFYTNNILEKILRYIQWIKMTHNDTSNYPSIYFCSKTKFDNQEWSSIESILLCQRFKEKISNLKYSDRIRVNNKRSIKVNKNSFNFLKKMIELNKLNLIPISDRKENSNTLYIQKDPILHDNCLLTNYGYFNWGNRDNGFRNALIKKKSINTRFSTIFRSKEFDLNDIFQFFNKEINLVSKKNKKVGNLFEIN